MAVATSLAIAGLAATAAGTGLSFAQANKQGKLQRQAKSDAEKAYLEAEKAAEVNLYEAIGIQKEPYQLEREATLSAGAQAIEALREGESRGAGAGVGRVQMAQQEAQGDIRGAMGQELMGLEMATAEQGMVNRDIGIQLNLEEAAGAQQAAADAQAARAQAIQQGMEGVTSMIQQGVQMIPLFQKGAAGRQLSRLQKSASKAGLTSDQLQQQLSQFGAANPQFANLSGVGKMAGDQFMDFMSKQSPEYIKSLRSAFAPGMSYDPRLKAPQQGMIGPSMEMAAPYTGPSTRLGAMRVPSLAPRVLNPYAINWADYLMPR